MNDLKLSLWRRAEVACLLLICAFAGTALAGEAKWPQPIITNPLIVPFAGPNSTFRSDFTVPHPDRRVTWEQSGEQQKKVALALDAWRLKEMKERFAMIQEPRPADLPTVPTVPSQPDPRNTPPTSSEGVQWKPLIAQSLTFLWIEHGFRFMTEPGTRAELRGPFFKDWFKSVARTRGWRDGDPFIVNYVGHPMQGSVTNYIFVHNDPKYIRQEMDFTKAYFKSRLRAMLFSTVYSTQFELGPLSEASLGNVGLFPSKTSRHPSAFVDLVITPTLGTVWMMGEDALDRYVIKRMESHVDNRVVRLLVRGFLNPSRSFANVLRGRYPWNRDGRRL